MIPQIDECITLMAEYGMLDNIKAHSFKVEKVARVLTVGLRKAGIGLSLARTFVELHGGRLWAESQGLGKGSEFIFTIPTNQRTLSDTR